MHLLSVNYAFILHSYVDFFVRAWLTLSKTSSLLWGMVQTNTKDSLDDVPIDSYCISRLYCSFPAVIVDFYLFYYMMGLLIWQEVGVQSLILRWPLKPMGLLLSISFGSAEGGGGGGAFPSSLPALIFFLWKTVLIEMYISCLAVLNSFTSF